MNTNRKFYSKPQTLRTQVALEQGMCAGSVFIPTSGNGVSVEGHTVGGDYDFNESSNGQGGADGSFSVTWE